MRTRIFRNTFLILGLAAGVATADFSYEQTTRFTGGSLLKLMSMFGQGKEMREPQKSMLYLKGNRLAMVSKDSITIIDLDKQTMTDVNQQKKTYAVITFQEMAQAMAEMSKRMNAELEKENTNASMDWKVDIKETGARKEVSGYPANQVIMTITAEVKDNKSGATMANEMVSDMWLADRIAGHEQVMDFYKRMAEKGAFAPMLGEAQAMMGRSGMSGMKKMTEEMSKLKGTPVLTVMRMEGLGGPPMPDMGEAAREGAKQGAGEAIGGAIGGRLGRLGGGILGGRRRQQQEEQKKEQVPPPQQQQQGPQKQVLLEITSESANFSTAPVADTNVSVPAGFKEVEHPMKEMLRKSR